MSEDQLKAFLEKVKGDTSLQEKLKAAASPEAALQIAKDAGFAITAEDIQSAPEELSDEDLEGAAGGILMITSPLEQPSQPSQPSDPIQFWHEHP